MNEFPGMMDIYIRGINAFNTVVNGIMEGKYGEVTFDLDHENGTKVKIKLGSELIEKTEKE